MASLCHTSMLSAAAVGNNVAARANSRAAVRTPPSSAARTAAARTRCIELSSVASITRSCQSTNVARIHNRRSSKLSRSSNLVTKAADAAAPTTSAEPSEGEKKAMQWKTLSILFVTYLCIYFVRKPLSVVKAPMQDALGLSTSAIAGIESVFLGAYAIGQFILPSLGDRLGAKNMLVAGYVVSAAACLGFGMTSVPLLLAATWAVNGFAQSLAHPLHVKVLTPWFKSSERGTAIGIWNTSQQVGGVVSTALAAFVLGIAGWRTAVVAPAVFVFISAGILAMTTLNPPWTEKERTVDSVDEGEEALPSMMEVLRIPKLPMLMVSYFFVKIVRYCLIFWLPFYLAKEIGMAAATAGYLSCVFDIGGVLGGIISGIICDKYFNGRRTIAGAGMCVFLTAAILAYQTASGMGMLVNAAVMGLVGFFVAGPDSMLGATAIADCVEDAGYGSEVLGTATGLVNGAGSVGAVFQGALTAYVAEAYGWGALFCTLALFSAISVVTLMLAVPDKKKGGGASAAVTA